MAVNQAGSSIPAQRTEALPLATEHVALLVACLALIGSLAMSMVMGLNACPLCFYQRTFIIAVAGVLGVGKALRLSLAEGTLSLLALPLAVAGLGVAFVHNYLVWTNVLVCPGGVFGLGTAPLQSLIAFLLLTALLLPGAVRGAVTPVAVIPRLVGLLVLGAAFSALAILSSPKVPPFKPTYDAAGARVVRSCERANP